jgi:hypothetical protein
MGEGLIDTDIPPSDGKGGFKRRFQVMIRSLGPDPKNDGVEKAVFIDGKKLDFSIDLLRLLEAKRMGPSFLLEEQRNTERRFLKSVSEAIGRKATTEEIKRAAVEGWI